MASVNKEDNTAVSTVRTKKKTKKLALSEVDAATDATNTQRTRKVKRKKQRTEAETKITVAENSVVAATEDEPPAKKRRKQRCEPTVEEAFHPENNNPEAPQPKVHKARKQQATTSGSSAEACAPPAAPQLSGTLPIENKPAQLKPSPPMSPPARPAPTRSAPPPIIQPSVTAGGLAGKSYTDPKNPSPHGRALGLVRRGSPIGRSPNSFGRSSFSPAAVNPRGVSPNHGRRSPVVHTHAHQPFATHNQHHNAHAHPWGQRPGPGTGPQNQHSFHHKPRFSQPQHGPVPTHSFSGQPFAHQQPAHHSNWGHHHHHHHHSPFPPSHPQPHTATNEKLAPIFADLQAKYPAPPPELKTGPLLGTGHYGSVHELQGCKDMALKRIPINAEWAPLEVTYLLAAQSPHVVRVEQVYYHSTFRELWVLMERMEGTLLDLLRRNRFDEGMLAEVAKQLLTALRQLHAADLVHMDLKPGNVLYRCTSEGLILKLTDFGCAQLASRGETDELGEFTYMAPEVVARKPRTCKTDVWNLAMSLLHLADGLPPLAGWDDELRKSIISTTTLVPKLAHPHEWSLDFNDFLDVCLRKSPEHRPAASDLVSHPFVVRAQPILLSSEIAKPQM